MAALARRMSAVSAGWNFCFQFPHGIHLQGVFLVGRKETVDLYWIHPWVFQEPHNFDVLDDLFMKSGDFGLVFCTVFFVLQQVIASLGRSFSLCVQGHTAD